MPLFPMLNVVFSYFCHKNFGKSLDWLHRKVFNRFFDKFSKPLLLKYVNEFLDLHLDQLYYPPAFKAFFDAQAKGDLVAILSSSPDFIVESIARRLQIQFWIGTSYLVDKQDCLCEIACIVDGKYKAEYLEKLIARYNISKESISAYSDSILDLPMFEAAGTKIGVNPSKTLYSHCIKHNWKII